MWLLGVLVVGGLIAYFLVRDKPAKVRTTPGRVSAAPHSSPVDQRNARPAAEQSGSAPADPVTQPAPPPPAPPASEDPEDATRRQMVHSAHAAVTAMMDKNQECHEKAEYTEKAFAVANMDVVNGVQQAEISKNNFRKQGLRFDEELGVLLSELRSATAHAEQQWSNLLFLLPPAENDVAAVMNWCMAHGVDSQIASSLVSNGMFINTDYGLTRESFWAEAARIEQALGGGGQ